MKQGFTLIELMVSLGILVMVIMSAMGVYIHVIGTREKALGQLNIQEEGQYLMSLMVKDIRAGKVDYSNYGGSDCGTIAGGTSLTAELCLLDFSSNEIRYKKESVSATRDVLKRCQAAPCASEDYQNITMTNATIERLDFYINPVSNPFTAGSTTYEHPRVTIVMRLRSLTEKPGTRDLILQQTVPQRYTFRK